MTHESDVDAAWHELLDTPPRARPARSSTGDRAVPATTGTSPTATGRSRRRSASLSTPTCSPSRAGRSSSSSTRRSAATAAGAATTPTPTTASRRARPDPPLPDLRQPRRQRSTSRSPATTSRPPAPGRTRSCCIVNDTDLGVDADGDFSLRASAPVPEHRRDAACTRDYQVDPLTGRPVTWEIEALDEPDPIRHGDAETAAGPAGQRRLAADDVRDHPADRRRARRRRAARPRPRDRQRRQHDRRALPGARTSTSAGRPRDACYSFGSYDLGRGRGAGRSRTGRRRAASGAWSSGTSSWPPTTPATGGPRSTSAPPCPTPTARSRSWSATARRRTPTR